MSVPPPVIVPLQPQQAQQPPGRWNRGQLSTPRKPTGVSSPSASTCVCTGQQEHHHHEGKEKAVGSWVDSLDDDQRTRIKMEKEGRQDASIPMYSPVHLPQVQVYQAQLDIDSNKHPPRKASRFGLVLSPPLHIVVNPSTERGREHGCPPPHI